MAMDGWSRTKPGAHPDVLLCQNNLAAVYHALGREAEAEMLLQRNLEAARRMFGPGNPHTLIAQNNLAMVYEAQGKRAEAEALLRETLAAAPRVLGLGSPREALTQDELARRYRARGYTEVIVLLRPVSPAAPMPDGPDAFAP
jgi:hypothetical protein